MRPVAALFVLTMVAGTASVGSAGSGGTSPREPGVAPRVAQIGLSERDLTTVAGELLTTQREANPFSLLALTWSPGPIGLPEVAVRTRNAAVWSDWTHLDPDPDGPDGTEPEARGLPGQGPREGTVALWTGDADAFQMRVQATHGGRAPLLPTDLRLVLVDPGHAPSDTAAEDPVAFTPATAKSDTWPRIADRADWGADESLRERPKYTGPVRAAFVHHTAGTNRYDRRDVPRIVRSIYAFHVKGRGWADLGYNFLVDKWGRVWEGRAGGVGLPVRGAHTGGFNRDSFGIAALGDFTRRKPSPDLLESLARVIRWKFDHPEASLDPSSWTRLTSTGGGTSRYKEGKEVSFRRISGHRDAGRTLCPGRRLYAALPALRERVAELQGSGDVEIGGGKPLDGRGEPAAPRPFVPPHRPEQPQRPPGPGDRTPPTRPEHPGSPSTPLPPIARPQPPVPPVFPWGP